MSTRIEHDSDKTDQSNIDHDEIDLDKIDQDKIDEVAFALLYLTLGDDGRAWKGMAWEISERLYEKGWIANPRNKNKSFLLTAEGREACARLFKQHFSKPEA